MRDQNIAQKIVEGLSPEPGETVIEIGPGTGVLTQFLLEKDIDLLALDVDKESIDYLEAAYPEHRGRFRQQDFLRMDLREIKSPHFRVIGNLPYNISSQIFFRIYDERQRVSEAVCMIQKEVADRLAAGHGSKTYGILSVLLQAFFKVEILFTVPPHVFEPPPKVQSAVLRLTRNETQSLSCDEKLFKRVVKEGFGKRRKTLRNALKNLNLPASVQSDTDFDRRAEQLSVEEFVLLTTKIGETWTQ